MVSFSLCWEVQLYGIPVFFFQFFILITETVYSVDKKYYNLQHRTYSSANNCGTLQYFLLSYVCYTTTDSVALPAIKLQRNVSLL